MMSLETLANDAGLSLEEIKDVTFAEFNTWSQIACKNNVVLRASIFQEWKSYRQEPHGEITSLKALCDQAGTTLQEVAMLSTHDFRELTKVLNVNSIAQHTLLFQEKKQLLDSVDASEDRDVTEAGPTIGIATLKKAGTHLVNSMRREEFAVPEHYSADARNDENSRDYRARSPIESARQQNISSVMANHVARDLVASQDENALLNDVLMSSHNIDPTGNGQLSLEFVWQLANTQHPAVEFTSQNEVVFSDTGSSRIGTRRYIKFVKSFRSLYLVSSANDRHVLAGLLVLVAQTRGYRFFGCDPVTGDLFCVSDEVAKSKTIETLLSSEECSLQAPSRSQEYLLSSRRSHDLLQSPTRIKQQAHLPSPKPIVRGTTRFTEAQDNIIKEEVMNSRDQPYSNWVNLTSKLPGFKSKQIRDRWVNHLNPEIDHSDYTEHDVSLVSMTELIL